MQVYACVYVKRAAAAAALQVEEEEEEKERGNLRTRRETQPKAKTMGD